MTQIISLIYGIVTISLLLLLVYSEYVYMDFLFFRDHW